MRHRWRDWWLVIEIRRVSRFPYLRLGVRSEWGTPDQAMQNGSPDFTANSRQTSGSQHRRSLIMANKRYPALPTIGRPLQVVRC